MTGRSATTVDSSWIDMLAGLSSSHTRRMPPGCCAKAGARRLGAKSRKHATAKLPTHRPMLASSARLCGLSAPAPVLPCGRVAAFRRLPRAATLAPANRCEEEYREGSARKQALKQLNFVPHLSFPRSPTHLSRL